MTSIPANTHIQLQKKHVTHSFSTFFIKNTWVADGVSEFENLEKKLKCHLNCCLETIKAW